MSRAGIRVYLVCSVHQCTPDWALIEHRSVLVSADEVAWGLEAALERLRGLDVLVDSGGYRLISKGRLPDPHRVLGVQRLLVEEVGALPVSLDRPVPPGAPSDEVERANKWTARMAREWARVFGDQFVLPLHAHTPEQLEHALKVVQGELGGLPERVGLGSLALLARRRPRQVLELLRRARELVDARLHVFGVGNSLLAAASLEGLADSVDTSSPLQDARYGLARHPVTLEMVLVAPRRARGRTRAAPEEVARGCGCPTCTTDPKAMASWGREGLRARALHNAYQLLRIASTPQLALRLLERRGLTACCAGPARCASPS